MNKTVLPDFAYYFVSEIIHYCYGRCQRARQTPDPHHDNLTAAGFEFDPNHSEWSDRFLPCLTVGGLFCYISKRWREKR
jgi:hypothetical protein